MFAFLSDRLIGRAFFQASGCTAGLCRGGVQGVAPALREEALQAVPARPPGQEGLRSSDGQSASSLDLRPSLPWPPRRSLPNTLPESRPEGVLDQGGTGSRPARPSFPPRRGAGRVGAAARTQDQQPVCSGRNAWHFHVVGFSGDGGFLELSVWVRTVESGVCRLLVCFRVCLFLSSCGLRVWVHLPST